MPAIARRLVDASLAWPTGWADPVEQFPDSIIAIAAEHQPSRMPFFRRLAALPNEAAHDPAMLGQLYLVYQSAMHATRAGLYFMPHLDSPLLRQRKLQIFAGNDGLAGGDTPHYQLARAFRGIGAALPLADDAFGDLNELCRHVDRATAHFLRLARSLYSRSLGAWCVVAAMSPDWQQALAASLSVHHPRLLEEPYFGRSTARRGGDEKHLAEAVEITQTVLRERSQLIEETLRDAEIMAEALDAVWDRLDAIVQTVM